MALIQNDFWTKYGRRKGRSYQSEVVVDVEGEEPVFLARCAELHRSGIERVSVLGCSQTNRSWFSRRAASQIPITSCPSTFMRVARR
jgi:hypothetical protein